MYNSTNKTCSRQLKSLQNAQHVPFRSYISPYHLQFSWLSTDHSREYLISSCAFNVIAHENPRYLVDRFVRISPDIVCTSGRFQLRSLEYTNHLHCSYEASRPITASDLIEALLSPNFYPSHEASFKGVLFELLLNYYRRIVVNCKSLHFVTTVINFYAVNFTLFIFILFVSFLHLCQIASYPKASF